MWAGHAIETSFRVLGQIPQIAASVEAWNRTNARQALGTPLQEFRESEAALAECDRRLALLAAAPGR